MSPESEKIRASFVDQLSSLEDRLADRSDDLDMLSDIQDGIGRLVGEGVGSEAQIRRVLQDRYESGDLRKETFQLVKSMLDRYVSEQAPTSPGTQKASARVEPRVVPARQPEAVKDEDPLFSTMVIPAADSLQPDTADGRVQVGSVLRDRFMLQERVSGGSMGVVYKALDRRLAEAGAESASVAIKILSPKLSQNGQALRALQQEAVKGRCLVHPNIVRFIDFDRDDDLYFIVMEWLEGRTLADILDTPDSRSIDTERAFKIVRQIGKALDYAHRCGIVHADVKPANVMIMPNGDAKIFDFGVARVRQKQLDKDPGFDPGVLGLLTPAYSSMQVLTGEEPSPADDVFSLGCLLYRLIAGYRVFGPRNAAEAAAEGMQPQPLEKLSDANWRVLKKALSYSRVTRFVSMADFIDALDVEAAEAITVDIPAPKRFSDSPEKRGPGRALFGLLVVLLLGAVVANQLGLLDELKDKYLSRDVAETTDETANFPGQSSLESAPAESDVGDTIIAGPVDEKPLEELVVESMAGPERLAPAAAAIEIPPPQVIAAPLVDFATLPRPTAELRIAEAGSRANSVTITLRENGREAFVDLIRSDVTFPLTLKLEEAGFSGNRSPWLTRQYTFSDNGYVEFPVGQERARVSLQMMPDQLREADQQSTLRIRDADSATSALGIINVVLEDDDQRAFESTLPADTVAFSSSQISVNEQDPAVQLDILRFNPGDSALVVGFALRDITATQGMDYFAPGGYTIEFGPGQRVARLLIPLVQDSEYEDNEAFSVELFVGDAASYVDVYQRVAIMILDDDQ
jgi:serine/threonine protein kinase